MTETSDLLSLAVLKAIKSGEIDTSFIFGDTPKGSPNKILICNSVPKAGTYLLLEIAKSMGFADIGFHLNTDFLERRTPDEKSEHPRPMPSILQLAAMSVGQCAPAHLHYSFALENYLLSHSEYRMLFIVRDPRDLVVSWVDYVYSSSAYRSTDWNTYCQEQAMLNYPTDEARISSSIDGLLAMGLDQYMSWLNSSACLTVRFEDLYAELSSGKTGPTIARIEQYVGETTTDPCGVLGKGRTASSRSEKSGIYRKRMSAEHFEKLRHAEFQKLVIQFGYSPTA